MMSIRKEKPKPELTKEDWAKACLQDLAHTLKQMGAIEVNFVINPSKVDVFVTKGSGHEQNLGLDIIGHWVLFRVLNDGQMLPAIPSHMSGLFISGQSADDSSGQSDKSP